MNALVTEMKHRLAREHEAAQVALHNAVAHAVQAGELLIEIKDQLPYGAFGEFCSGLPFAPTTARAYMRLARLDPAERQRVAVLPLRVALLEIAESREQEVKSTVTELTAQRTPEKWTPKSGHWHMLATDQAAFHVVPAVGYPGFFHISKLYGDNEADSFWRGTYSAIPASQVCNRLVWLGLADPAAAPWEAYERPGLTEAFGIPADLFAGSSQDGAAD